MNKQGEEDGTVIFYTADTLFGDEEAVRLYGRPFDDAEDMDAYMTDTWNAKVSDGDTVYILGDMFGRCTDPERVLKRLKGKKRLIAGNRDNDWLKKIDASKYFLSVEPFAEVSNGKRRLVLCHYPLMTWDCEHIYYMVHGHIHNKRDGEYWPLLKNNPRILNAGVDINGFWPVTFEQMAVNNECFKKGIYIDEHNIRIGF